MDYRLGLDLGTNSIGWAVLKLGPDGTVALEDAGVRIFPNGREPAGEGRIGEPLAVKRRMARAQRRLRDRRNRRRLLVLHELVRAGYLPPGRQRRKEMLRGTPSDDPRYNLPASGQAARIISKLLELAGLGRKSKADGPQKHQPLDPYYLRAEALDRDLTSTELARVLMHLALRRGFQSNRKADATENAKDLSAQKQDMRQLAEKIAETGSRTLGEYLWKRRYAGKPVRFRRGSVGLYPSRAMYRNEFAAVRARQEQLHRDLDWDRIEVAIFYQRPLRPVERGRCRYYTSELRAYADQPSIARFRALQEVHNLSFVDSNGAEVSLSRDERQTLLEMLRTQKTVSFDKIRQIVGVSAKFNLEDSKRDKLKGDSTSFEMRKPERFGALWDKMTPEDQDSTIESLHQAVSDEQAASSIRSVAPTLTESEVSAIVALPLARATAAVSARFARDCSAIMEQSDVSYVDATKAMGYHHSEDDAIPIRENLPYYGEILPDATTGADPEGKDEQTRFGRVPNPTVHVAMNQLRAVVNALLVRFGRPSEIVVELGRELKLSPRRAMDITKRQAANQKENERIRAELMELGVVSPSGADVLKYKLWEELGSDRLARTCVYCGKTISASEIIGPATEVDHILPRSRTLLNSRSNLVVAHKACNQLKGNRSPYEAFGSSPEGFDYEAIIARAKRAYGATASGKLRKFSSSAMTDIQEVGDFLASQQSDNAYIARLAVRYLGAICPKYNIWPTVGRLTWDARREWGIDTILARKERVVEAVKNRRDHRHHALDAIVTGLLTRATVQQVARLSAREDQNRYSRRFVFPECPVPRERIIEVIKRMVVSHKPDHGLDGQLLKETAMGEQAFPSAPTEAMAGSKLWAFRKPTTSLTPAEVAHAIADPVIRQALQNYLSSNQALKHERALEEFAKETGVRRLRVVAHKQNPVRVPSAPYKAYEPVEIAYCEIWQIPGKKVPKYEGRYWSLIDARNRDAGDAGRPHPAAKKLMRLYKNDAVELRNENHVYYARVVGFASQTNKIDLRPVNCANSIADWMEETTDEMTRWPLRRSKGQNHESIQQVFSRFRVRYTPVSPDGLVRSKGSHP